MIILRWLNLLIVGSLFVGLVSGCVSREGYKVLTVKNIIAKYSIEYPTTYNKDGPRVDLDRISPACYLDLLTPKKNVELKIPDIGKSQLKTVKATYIPASIEINIFLSNTPISGNTAKEHLDGYLSEAGKWEHFQLIDRSPVVISGINGEVITFVEDWFMPFADNESNEPKLKYFKVAGFDYGGYIWIITAQSEKEMNEKTTTDFNHILQTFKILE